MDTLVDKRDSARAYVEVLQGQVNQLYSGLSEIENEREELKQEVNTLIQERDATWAEADVVRTRIRVVDHQQCKDESNIILTGFVVKTGIEDVDYTFHVTGYDMTGELVIDR